MVEKLILYLITPSYLKKIRVTHTPQTSQVKTAINLSNYLQARGFTVQTYPVSQQHSKIYL